MHQGSLYLTVYALENVMPQSPRSLPESGLCLAKGSISAKPFFFFNVYLFLRDRAQVGKEQREGDTESEAGSRLCDVSTEPKAGAQTPGTLRS